MTDTRQLGASYLLSPYVSTPWQSRESYTEWVGKECAGLGLVHLELAELDEQSRICLLIQCQDMVDDRWQAVGASSNWCLCDA